MAESTLKEKTSKGLFWGGLSSFLQQLLNAVFGIYLARTLSPDDYGLVGMLAVFSLLALILQEGGFISALVNRKEIRHEDYNAVFWFNLLVALACYALLFFCAPLIAAYFRQPALVKIARWSFLGFVLAGLGTSHRAYLTKKLMVKEMAIVTMVAVTVSGLVGIFFAWKGYGYWALVIQSLVLAFLTNAGFWLASDWRPSFRVDFQPVKEMFRFSAKLMLTSALGILNANLVTVILGRYYSAERVGYYTQASKWSSMGSTVLSGMVNSVSHPVLAEVVDEKERQVRVFRKIIRFAAFISFPAMLGLAFIAPEFILLALKDKWADSILLLQILCVGGAVLPLCNTCVNLLLSHGRSTQYMWANIVLFVLILAAMYLSYPLGVTGMVAAVTALNLLWLFVWAFLVRRQIGYTLRQLLADLVPFLGATLAAIGVAYLLTSGIENRWWLLTAKILITASLYFLTLYLAKSVTLKESLAFLLKKSRS